MANPVLWLKMWSKRADKVALRAGAGLRRHAFQTLIEQPDETTHAALRGALSVGERIEFVDETLGVDPA